MAEGRMLKRVITTSTRLAALKNDTNRLIYTWIIPFLDVEGRLSADPRIIKGCVCPLLDHVTLKIINNSLADMAENDLIVLYQIGNNKYLQLQRFSKHQTLRDGRERKSDIPPPTDGLPTEYRRSTAQQGKLREGKLIEDKGNGDGAAPFILPTKEEIQESSDPKLEEDIGKVCQRLYEDKIFPEVNVFKNKMRKNKKNLRAILHVLSRCYLSKPDDPWAFCQKIIQLEDLNYNERDYQKTAQ